jgi:tetratricopeptide (TPR) repeat protein
MGLGELGRGRFFAAVPLFQRAATLDPNFAMAYYCLGMASLNGGDKEHQDEYSRKAYSLISRVSEYERYLISSGYYQSTGDLYKDVDVYRLAIADYPHAWGFHNGLSADLIDLGQFEDGLMEDLVALELQPNVEPPYRRLLDAYMCLGRLSDARNLAEKARLQGIDGARIHQRFLEMAYIEDDQAAAAREVHWFAGRPEEYLSFGLQAADLNLLGLRSESGKFYKRAAQTARMQGLPSVAAGFEEADARADALLGNCGTVRRLGRHALALAMCGETAQAEKFIAETSKAFQMARSGMRFNYQRFAPLLNSSAIGLLRRWSYWYPPCLSSMLTRRRYTSEVRHICICVRARKVRSSFRKFWITAVPVGAILGFIRIGDSIIRFPPLVWREHLCSKEIPLSRRRHTTVFSHSGRQRILTLPF